MRKGLWVISSLLAGTAWGLPQKEDPKLQGVMQGIYQQMTQLIPLSLSEAQFFDPKNRPKIKKIYDNLDQLSSQLKERTKGKKDGVFKDIRDDFLLLGQRSKWAFEKGNLAGAQAMIGFQTEYCMSCHTQSASKKDAKTTLSFFDQVAFQELNPLARAKYLTIARQFDKALTEYENLMTKGSLTDEEKILLNPYKDYLILGLRVKEDPPRVKKTLETLVKGQEPLILKQNFTKWLEALASFQKLKKPWTFATAEKILAEGRRHLHYPSDRSGVVHFIVASGILRASLESKTNWNPDELAHHYLLLGETELVIDGFDFHALRYFEDAVRSAPKSSYAAKALALFEDTLIQGFTGSRGTSVPDEDRARLDELKELVKSGKKI